LSAAILSGDVSKVRILLPEDLQNTKKVKLDDLVRLAQMLGPVVKRRTEEIFASLSAD
jgi:hypothetical protein